MRKYRSFLSPDDALRDLRKHASQGAEIRWELHTSRTDVDLASRTRCSCHSLMPREEKRHPERGDLRKHHSAEKDKWSLRPDTEHDLRKHLSDDSRMAREPKWTLQVPEVHANPKQRCTCPKPQRALSPSPSGSYEEARRHSLRLSDEEPERRSLRASRSLTPEDPRAPPQQTQLQKRLSADSRSSRERGSVSPIPAEQPPQVQVQLQQQPPVVLQPSEAPSKKASSQKERLQPSEAKRVLRSKWGAKPHFSLPAEKKESKWVKEDTKSKSLKERPKYSVRRSMSPDPDPRQVLRLDNRIVRRLISPEITIMDAKWAPYEGYSPLPNVGIKKRETKKISDIKWVPYDGESPIAVKPAAEPEPTAVLIDEAAADEPPKNWSPFHNITPTHLPPLAATPMRNDEEDFRWRLLNQVSAFPIYQGAWREESPPPTPPPPDHSTPVWSPLEPTMLRVQTSQMRPSPSPPPSPPPQKRSTLKVRTTSRKKALRTKSQESTRLDERQQQQQQQQSIMPKSIMRASSEEPKRQRPQLMRSKALLDVPHIDASKRSLSEEVRSSYNRTESTKRGLIFRAKSEDAARYGNPWFADADDDRQELREYVTTV